VLHPIKEASSMSRSGSHSLISASGPSINRSYKPQSATGHKTNAVSKTRQQQHDMYDHQSQAPSTHASPFQGKVQEGAPA
jgi:hypothetical protein